MEITMLGERGLLWRLQCQGTEGCCGDYNVRGEGVAVEITMSAERGILEQGGLNFLLLSPEITLSQGQVGEFVGTICGE